MRARRSAAVALTGAAALSGLVLGGTATAGPVHAAAVPAGAVPFASASFAGYGSGDEAHVAALNLSSTQQVAGVTQAFSGATSTGPAQNLTAPLTGDNAGVAGSGLLVQPAQTATVRAFGTGTGLSAGVGAAPNGSGNQLNQAGTATQVAPPNGAPVTATLPPGGLNAPAGLVSAGLVTGQGDAFYDPTGCPLGQPLSFGTSNAANTSIIGFSGLGSGNPLSSLLSALPISTIQSAIPGLSVPTSGSLISTGTTPQAVAESDSETFLSNNGDGTFGYTTQAREIIAPLSVNLFGAATLNVTVSGSQTDPTVPPGPVTLTATTTGEGGGASITLASNDFVGVTLQAAGSNQATALVPPTSLQQLVGQGGITLDINPSTLVSQLSTALPNLLQGTPLAGTVSQITGALAPVLSTVGAAVGSGTSGTPLDVSFGTLSLGTPIRALNGPAGSSPVVVGGTQASGAIDVARLHLGLSVPSGSGLPSNVTSAIGQLADIADVTVGHLEASAANSQPILCPLPVIKSVDQQSVTAGGSFTYTIEIPDPAKLADLACNLTNVSATDTITDYKAQPLFQVTAASNGGTFTNAPSMMSSTVNWAGLSYTRAAPGQAAAPPITLTVTVATPANSPAGVIQDVVNATGTAAGCSDAASGLTNLGNVNGAVLTGAYTLQAPAVTTSPAPPAPAATPPQLPHTGGTGGWWQPLGGLGALALGGGALYAARRGRRSTV